MLILMFRGRRKKIVDFYSRTSMSSYCTAFSYRPVVESVSDELADLYLEVPEEISIFRNPLTSRSGHVYLTIFNTSRLLFLGLLDSSIVRIFGKG